MYPRRNKLAPVGITARTANFLLNFAVAVSWLFRRAARIFAGRTEK